MGNHQCAPLRQQLLLKRKYQFSEVVKHKSTTPPKIQRKEPNIFEESNGFPFGSIVLAKLKASDPYWPGVVVRGCDVGHQHAKENCCWVFWLGCKQISEVRLTFVIAFDANKVTQKPGKALSLGMLEAKQELSIQISANNSPTIDTVPCLGLNQYLPLSVSVWNQIKEFKDKNSSVSVSGVNKNIGSHQPVNSCTRKARTGLLKLSEFCISCDDPRSSVVRSHPIVFGGICQLCLDSVKETIFDCGLDGAGSYCTVCAKPGDLLVCDHPNCLLRTFCTLCISRLDSPEMLAKALSSEIWICYLCQGGENIIPAKSCLIQARPDWRAQLMLLFGANKVSLMPPVNLQTEKRAITVLSLFDGISSGRIALDRLGVLVSQYYAAEVDESAIKVSNFHLGQRVTHLGKVELLTEEMLSKLDPIDLVIGGSPCNDLSLVNPDRKGLYNITGTGVLFFEFFRVLKTIQLHNKGRHIFWMFENVAAMPMEYRAIINRFLQCEPAILDAANFSAQRRPRFFWGNIPGMHSPLSETLAESCHNLQSILDPGREARVDQLRTITTNSNSLRQGKDNLLPILENGQAVLPNISELERLFGFPEGFTNVDDFSMTARLRLLGKAWSIPVIMHIFRPLKTFFSSVS